MRGLILSGMALIAATYGLARFGYGLFLPQLGAAFALSPAVAGVVQSGSFLSYCFAAALAARLAPQPRWTIVAAGATAAAGSVGIALAQSPVALAVSVIVAGAGAGFASPALVALVQRAVPAAREERAQTTVNAGTGVGILAAALLLVAAGDHWRAAWAGIALLSAGATVAVLLTGRRAASVGRPTPGSRRGGAGLVRALAAPIAAALLAGASSAAIWTFGSTLLTDTAPLGPGSAVLAWAILGAFGAAGAWAARVVQAWSLRVAWVATTLTMVGATLALGLGLGFSADPGVLLGAVALVGVAAFGAGYTALSGVLIVWAARIDAPRAAQGTVVLFIALAVGQSLGAAMIGALMEPLSPAGAFAVASALGAAALLPAIRPGGGVGSPTPLPPGSSGRRRAATTS
ncbi:MFS transporter [Agrococcus sp. Marseille-P2731]|uniref:MFS transporter n=1 Tax=Agrococcus sp. Marseille-P2731 TaxID=1841862 RepID=UPI0009FB1F46|nr:MFS transporter [Agrococcus sp. Marseille-P2731]